MSTPALARATEALWKFVNEETPEFEADGLDPMVIRGMEAHAVVSAALHDPDDPAWLARVHDEHRRISPAHMDTSLCSCGERFPTQWRWCQHVARAARAAILGEA